MSQPAAAPSPPPISVTTLTLAGILVDIYGLAELAASATRVSVLWLHHGRTRSRADMARFARPVVAAYNNNNNNNNDAAAAGGDTGLIALAFDQRNHGSRLVDAHANGAWTDGNARHAIDMFAAVAGAVADQALLMDLLGGYLFVGEGREIVRHLVMGVSLGGHVTWQSLFADERVQAGVVVIGCPDFENLMRDRARLSKLSTYSADDAGASFAGSKDFPPALVEAVKKTDPKGILFGTSAVPAPGATSEAEKKRLRPILDAKIRGKKVLVLSGGDDELVPYARGKPFLDWFKDATSTWYADGDVYVEDIVYPGVGHAFSPDMAKDAIRFVLDVLGGEANAKPSKI